jgi:signal transduction histidine kinase
MLLGLAALVLVAVASSGWLVLQVARTRLADAQETEARLVAGELVRVLRESYDPSLPLGYPGNAAQLRGTARALVDRGDVDEVAIVDADGRALLGDADGELREARHGTMRLRRSGGTILVYAPLPGAAGALGAARMRLAGADVLGQALTRARLLLVTTTLFDGALVALLGALFVTRLVRPLEALAAQARRVGAGELDAPPLAPGRGTGEIGRLVDDFNRMTASLKQQREHLVAQEKLVTVGRLAAGVAHEVGNPLAAVLGYVDLLLADEPPGPPGNERRELLERVRTQTERIRGIIADLLDYSRPVAGRVEPVRFADVVDAARTLLAPQARFRDVTLISELPPSLPPVAASTSRVVQVLVNLLLNAADAMGGKGTVQLSAVERDGRVELSVRDSGPGVPAADRGRVFEPFFTTKEPGQGTGLGLAISRSIVEAYGGTLTLAATDAGPGATFIVSFPASDYS